IFRPLLSYNKNELIEYLSQKNISYIEDPSNQDIKFQRVAIRKFLSQSNNLIDITLFKKGLINVANNLQNTQNLIDYYLHLELNKCIIINPLRYIELNIDYFDKLPYEMKIRIIEYILKYVNPNNKGEIRHSKISFIINNINKKHNLYGCHLL